MKLLTGVTILLTILSNMGCKTLFNPVVINFNCDDFFRICISVTNLVVFHVFPDKNRDRRG